MTTDEYWHTIAESYREKPQEPCEDAISRQAAIAALKKHFSDGNGIDTECGAYWHHGHVIDVLQGMPSVAPMQEPCEDCISRQAAIDAFSMFAEYESNRTNAEWVDRIRVVLSSLPPVQSIRPSVIEDIKAEIKQKREENRNGEYDKMTKSLNCAY